MLELLGNPALDQAIGIRFVRSTVINAKEPILSQLLQHTRAPYREAAVSTWLQARGKGLAVERLWPFFEDHSSQIRQRAGMYTKGADWTAGELEKLATSQYSDVRAICVRLAAQKPPEVASAIIEELLFDDSDAVREAAVQHILSLQLADWAMVAEDVLETNEFNLRGWAIGTLRSKPKGRELLTELQDSTSDHALAAAIGQALKLSQPSTLCCGAQCARAARPNHDPYDWQHHDTSHGHFDDSDHEPSSRPTDSPKNNEASGRTRVGKVRMVRDSAAVHRSCGVRRRRGCGTRISGDPQGRAARGLACPTGARVNRAFVPTRTRFPTLLAEINRVSTIKTAPDPMILRSFEDPEMFKYPFIYANFADRKDWTFSPLEIQNLKRYLERGGFLYIDAGDQCRVSAGDKAIPGQHHSFADWSASPALKDAFHALYPEKEFRPLEREHELYDVMYPDLPDASLLPDTVREFVINEKWPEATYSAVGLKVHGRVAVLATSHHRYGLGKKFDGKLVHEHSIPGSGGDDRIGGLFGDRPPILEPAMNPLVRTVSKT